MAGIVAGRLDVRPDGSVVPAVEPGSRAPLSDPYVLLSPHLADQLAVATHDLAVAMPGHLASRSLRRPCRFRRDVDRLAQIVSLHATLAEVSLAHRELTRNLSASPLAEYDPWTALALQLPNPPAGRLDELRDWLAADSPGEDSEVGLASAFGADGSSASPTLEQTEADPFDAALCLQRIADLEASLDSLRPSRPVRSGLRLLYPRLVEAAPAGSGEPPSSPARPLPVGSGRVLSIEFEGRARPEVRRSAQPSLGVFPTLSLFPACFSRALGGLTLERFVSDPPSPSALGRRLRLFVTDCALEFLFPLIYGRSGPASWSPSFSHAPP